MVFRKIVGSIWVQFWGFRAILRLPVSRAWFVDAVWYRKYTQRPSGGRFLNILKSANLQKWCLSKTKLFKTNYSKPFRETSVDLLYRVHLKHQNWILFCFNELNLTELNWTQLNWTHLKWTQLNSTQLNWTQLNWTQLSWTQLNWTELNWNELNSIELNSTQLNSTQFNWTPLNWTQLNWT